ncbi:MAG: hypothetical protein Q9185_000287 [Variospora sp. 1 TL-2023]
MKSQLLPTILLALTPILHLISATCNRDNCLRALAATPTKASSFCSTYTKTPSTATPVPTYGSFCSNSPFRASSACSCLVTTTSTSTSTAPPTCTPTPVINGTNFGNGDFENYPPPGQGVFNIQPPWFFTDAQNAFGEYRTVAASGAGYGGTVAAFVMSPSPPSTFPGAVLRLRQPIAYCNGTTYAFSLYARQLPPSTLTCRLAFFTDFEGTIADFEPLAGEWTRYGPVTRAPFRDNGVRNAKGEWEDRLDVLVQCLGVEGVEGVRTAVEVDGVRVLPV